jgi:ribosomal protein S24E
MLLKVIEQKENVLLHRKEVTATVTFDKATPSNADVMKELAAKCGGTEDAIVMKKIDGGFGNHTAHVKAFVYASAEHKAKIEPKKKAKIVAAEGAPAAK